MRILTGAVGLVLLAGCSSVSDTRDTAPLLQVSSSNSAKQVAECIRDGWQNIAVWGAGIGGTLQESNGRYTVFSPDSQTPWHLADVTPTLTGSKVSYHFYRTWQSPIDRVPEVVKSCAR